MDDYSSCTVAELRGMVKVLEELRTVEMRDLTSGEMDELVALYTAIDERE